MNSRPNHCQKLNLYFFYMTVIRQISTMFWTLAVRIAWVLVLDFLTFSSEVVLALVCPELPPVEVKVPFILSNS